MDYLVYEHDQQFTVYMNCLLFEQAFCMVYSVFLFLCTDDVIDETYGVAVQFDEEEEEVALLEHLAIITRAMKHRVKFWVTLFFICISFFRLAIVQRPHIHV